MSPKVKGLFKGLKYITQIFVYKEQEMEIGHPTDVKHVAHIGFDCHSSSEPSWMSQYKCKSESTPSSVIDMASRSSTDFKPSRKWQSVSSSGNSTEGLCPGIPKPSKKKKKRKKAQVCSPTTSISSSRASFSTALEEPIETPTPLPVSYEERESEIPSQLRSIITEPLCV